MPSREVWASFLLIIFMPLGIKDLEHMSVCMLVRVFFVQHSLTFGIQVPPK